MTNLTISQRLARAGVALTYEDLPPKVQDNAKKFILDVIGCILAAKEHKSAKIMVDTVYNQLGGRPDSTILGYGYKTAPNLAALANGTMGHSFDSDDDHREGIQHPSIVVFPALLALAEKYGIDGKTFLTSFVFGSEITIRAGESFLGQTYYQGFHPTGTCGVFGSSAGAAKLLGLDETGIARAMGLAGSQAAGLLEWKAQGTWSKRYQAGHAAMCGVVSALLAKGGFTSPTTVFEGEDGFIRAYSYKDIYDVNKMTDNFGDKWEMEDTSIKVHSCCRFSAPLADCGVDLYKRGVKPEDVESILAKVNKYSIKVLCVPEERKYNPETEVDAQFSLPYAIACGMVKGRESLFEFTEEAIKNEAVRALMQKVKYVLDPEAEAVYPRYYPCTVIVKTKDGREIVSHVDYPKGDPENPVNFDETIVKFQLFAGQTIGKNKSDRVIEYVRDLDKLDDIGKLISCLY
jgi:2-methylcitrate dehydratase PrpD